MIARLRRKMIITIMSFITVFLVLLITMMTFIPINRIESQTEKTLRQVMRSYVYCLKTEDMYKKVKYKDLKIEPITDPVIIVEMTEDNQVRNWTANRKDLYKRVDVLSLKEKVDGHVSKFGIVDGYYYRRRKIFGDRVIYAFIDTNSFYDAIMNSLLLLVAFGIFSWCFFLWITIAIVEKMLKPVKESFQKQKQFIADAGHELKTPVAVIMANTNVLEREIGKKKWLDYISMEANRMQSLIKSLMTLAELEDQNNELGFEYFDLSYVVMGAALPYESLAFEKGILISFEVAEGISFYGNREKISQMVAALISNAVAYSNENGIIQVGLTKKKKGIELSIYNTGIGIREADYDRIFERFYRVDSSRKRDSENYGLGLSIVQSIVNEHHGKINISGTYGKDVCFMIYFTQ